MKMVLRRMAEGVRSFLGSPEPDGVSLQERVDLPSAAIYVYWEFVRPVDTLEWDLTVHVDPGSAVGEYLALFNGSIDGSMCYLGLQTDVFHPQAGRGVGKGLIFSTWWSFDASDVRVADDGFLELGTHEGRFVGIRRTYDWATGDYRVTLSRSESDVVAGRVMDWFDLSIQPLAARVPGCARPAPVGSSEGIGAIRFPRRDPHRPATIEPGGLLFLEVYSGARIWADVAPWHVDVMAFGDGARCPSGRIEYPRPYGRPVPGADARYDERGSRIDLRLGTDGKTREPPARWP